MGLRPLGRLAQALGRMNQRFRKSAKAGFCALLVGALAAAGVLSVVGLSDRIASADAVVVPGNTVNPDGSPSARLAARLDISLAAFQAGRCKVIVVSGARGAEGIDEAEAMKRYLVKAGVPPDHILQDSRGFNTEATAHNAAQMLHKRGFNTVLAVSQFFHVPRLRHLLAAQGLEVVGNEHARYFEARDIYSTFREVAAMSVLYLRCNAP